MNSIPESLLDPTRPFALVTGAAKRLGREIALHLAQIGYGIGLHYFTSVKEAEKTAQEISSMGVPVKLLQADLRDSDQVKTLFNEVDRLGSPLKLLVNSASIMPISDLMTFSPLEWDDLMDTNLKAVWWCSQMAARRMPSGSLILNLSDSGTNKNWTRYGAYLISKSGVEALTRILAKQLAPEIRVCGISPGLYLKSEKTSEKDWNRLVQKVPLQREGDPFTLTSTIDLLLSNQYITGEIIHLDGGSHLG
ncbi:MAG: SDR family oxidoreductase [Chloroflexi bacterium]|nr:SDR family oxidoreductase [Chloroflexota bacterium]